MIQARLESVSRLPSTRRRLASALAALAWVGFAACLAGPTAAQGLDPNEVEAGYRDVLAVLAAGDLERALEELVEFEQRVVGEPENAWRHMEKFWRLKLKVIRRLLESQSIELLEPITLLHHDAYLEYSRLDRRHLAQHSRQMSSELAEVYAQQAGSEAAREFSGSILASFAANSWSPISMGGSADLFYRTYLVDPGNLIALKGLAAAHERSGDYEKAIDYLRQAADIDSRDSEVALRLALCLIRFESDPSPQAISSLSVLIDLPHPVWIRSLAYQELAKLWIERQRDDEAEALLREGLGALPGDPQLSLLLAALLDRQRRRDEATGTLEAVVVQGWQEDSPRQRYAMWEPEGMEEIRQALREEMKQGLPALALGLQTVPTREVAE